MLLWHNTDCSLGFFPSILQCHFILISSHNIHINTRMAFIWLQQPFRKLTQCVVWSSRQELIKDVEIPLSSRLFYHSWLLQQIYKKTKGNYDTQDKPPLQEFFFFLLQLY